MFVLPFLFSLVAFVQIGVLSQNLFFQLAAAINRQTLTIEQLTVFGLIILGFYAVSLVYRGKRHVDFMNQQRREFDAFRAASKDERPLPLAERQPTAPPENEYYELHY